MLYLKSINAALHSMMRGDPEVVLIGEDLLDPYGGAFKVSKGLSTAFPKQVISTPISESAIVGLGIGMAMRGFKPIVEIMFGDFLALASDQIINHATKYQWMFNDKVSVPIVIRAPMGGGRGYGPTHSQSIESLFMAVSGLKICAPSIYHDPGKLLIQAVKEESGPILFIENKVSYPKNLQLDASSMLGRIQRSVVNSNGIDETVLLSLYPDEKPDLVIITYGGMSELAVQAAVDLFFEEELVIHVLSCSLLRPVPINDFVKAAARCGQILVLEEGNKIGGWGAEVASQIHEAAFKHLRLPVARIGASDMPIPSALPLEEQVLPTVGKIIEVVKQMMKREY